MKILFRKALKKKTCFGKYYMYSKKIILKRISCILELLF